VLLTVSDAEGRPVRRVVGPAKTGIHRVAWDLRRPPPDPVDLEVPEFRPPWASSPQGPFAPPGTYRVEMALLSAAGFEPLGEPQQFEVKPVPGSGLSDSEYHEATAFQEATGELARRA
jgi:hypothetical protein